MATKKNKASKIMSNNVEQKKGGCLRTIGIMLVTIIISVAVALFLANHYLFPKKFSPTKLGNHEETTLNQKLKQFGLPAFSTPESETNTNKLEPSPYTEEGAKREVSFTEKELNAMLAKNTDLADKAVIDLSENLASVNVLLPLDQDFPILGGKTLKLNAGAELAFANGKPIVKLKGVSLWGIPMPNAWLGNLKNVDLVKEFGGDEGFWKSFADGVENIHVAEGRLIIKLKE